MMNKITPGKELDIGEELDAEFDSFLAEIDTIEENNKPEPIPDEPSPPPWRECVDDTTQHPYYWHIDTGEVTWIMPDPFEQDTIEYDKAMIAWKNKCEEIHKKIKMMDEKEAKEKKPFPPIKPSPPSVIDQNGPMKEFKKPSESLKYEIGGIGKFRFQKPDTPGPPKDLPPSNSKRLTFKVAGTKNETTKDDEDTSTEPEVENNPASEVTSPVKTIPVLPKSTTNGKDVKQRTAAEIGAEIRKKKQQIALSNTRLLLQKRVEEARQKKLEESNEEKPVIKEKKKEHRKIEPKIEIEPVSRKRRIFQEVKIEPPKKEIDKDLKRAVEKESNLMKDKLEFLGGDRSRLSKFQVHLIALETRLKDWEAGHLCETYMQAKVTELAQLLRTHEENSVQKEWTCTWDKEQKRYKYTNKLNGHSQLTHPGEDEKSSSSDSGSETEEEIIPEKDDDDLYEQFQKEISQLEDTKEKKRPPSPPSTEPQKKPCPSPARPAPARPAPVHPAPVCHSPKPTSPVKSKSISPIKPPKCTTPPINMAPYVEPEPMNHYMPPMDPWGYSMMMPGYPGMPGIIPSIPPPPPEIDQDTYSPGNSDDEDYADVSREDKGVVSVGAPLKYMTPPPEISSEPVSYTATEKVSNSINEQSKVTGSDEGVEKKEEKNPEPVKSAKKVVKKKKKTETLTLNSSSSSGKKNRNMSSLVAKWNAANKNADVAITKTKK